MSETGEGFVNLPPQANLSAKDNTAAEERNGYQSYERYFLGKRPQLVETLTAARKTPHGNKTLQPSDIKSEMTYRDFTTAVPFTDPSEVKDNPQAFLKGDPSEMLIVHSSGTSGKPKEFYWPKEELDVKFTPTLEQKIIESQNPLLIHGDWESTDFLAIEKGVTDIRPNTEIFKYDDASEAVLKMQDHDLSFITADITSFRAFMFDLDTLFSADPQLPVRLAGKEFYIDLNSEPITAREIDEWHKRLQDTFKMNPYFSSSYGQTDTGNLGLYIHKPGDTEADLKYKISDQRLFEVVDDQGNLVIDKKGDVIVTTLRKDGTIFVRYRTGDEAILSIDKAGNANLSEIGRKSESGMLTFWGEKMFIPEFYEGLLGKLGFPFQLEASQIIDTDNKHQNLSFALYSESFGDGDELNQASQSAEAVVRKALEKDENFSRMMDVGMLGLSISFQKKSPEGFHKGWRIKPAQTDSTPTLGR